ncbi:ATP-binding protein [Streptomyces sp. NPDC051636]|uniref:ATP-binding protein n=1 Tax=Streptomyces sp. NPDC051636 TaxID=3365663 RepID=UPI00379D1228
MGTATAPSTTLPAGSVLAGQKEASLRPSPRILKEDAMDTAFCIMQRAPGQPVPTRDARRVPNMRRIARARLNLCGLTSMVEPVTTIVSELVTNAVVHSGGTEVTFRMQLQDGLLYVAVGSNGPGSTKPTVQASDADAEHGRGLQLVKHMVEESDGAWGVNDQGATTTVWCLFPTKEGDQ